MEYNDGYEKGDPQFEMVVQSSDWIVNQGKDLLKQYNECQTKRDKSKILKKLSFVLKKLSYERRNLESLIKKGKEDEGLI